MKYLLLSLLVLIGIVSCQKEITDEVPGGVDTTIVVTPTGKMEADIDSVRWVANGTVKATYSAADTSGFPPYISISATSTDGRTLVFGGVDSIVRTKVYDMYAIDTTFFISAASYSDSSSATKGAFSSQDSIFVFGTKVGSFAITSFDTVNKTISGSFSFKVGRESDSSIKTFTNGTFTKVPYTKAVIPGNTGTDSFHVKINDTLFNAYTVAPGVGAGAVSVNGVDSLGQKTVVVSFSETITPGSYTFDMLTRSAIYSIGTTVAYPVTAGTGSLQIIENNSVSKRVRANFSFVGKRTGVTNDSARLTEGYFSVELP